MHTHSKHQVVRTQVNKLGILVSGCGTLHEPEAIEIVGVLIVHTQLLN